MLKVGHKAKLRYLIRKKLGYYGNTMSDTKGKVNFFRLSKQKSFTIIIVHLMHFLNDPKLSANSRWRVKNGFFSGTHQK